MNQRDSDPAFELGIANFRYLIVDDHSFQRWEMARMLKDQGATQVFEAADGTAALDLLRDLGKPVDIVITDLNMPEMDGMELARHLAEMGKCTSMILVSAMDKPVIDSVGTMVEMYGMPLLGVLEKPVSREKLRQAIANFDPSFHRTVLRDCPAPVVTLGELRAGLEAGEFFPYYQPKVELSSGRIAGVEALARWRHPRLGVVAACEFAHMVEEASLSDELTWTILNQAAGDVAHWQKAGLEIGVAFNISQKSLSNTDLAEKLTDMITRRRLQPQQFVIEITESATAGDSRHALENLARMRMRGFRLSIDDYGTGYSSMQQLMRIAFNEIKIDRSFVNRCNVVKSQMVVLESFLSMARQLALTTVAEGIETRAEFVALRDLGCDLGQGYYFALPMEAAKIPTWVERFRLDDKA